MRVGRTLVLALCCLAFLNRPLSSANGNKRFIVQLPFAAEEITTAEVDLLGQFLWQELSLSGEFTFVDPNEAAQKLGSGSPCFEPSCAQSAGQELGAEAVIIGRVSRSNGAHDLEVQTLSVSDRQVLFRYSKRLESQDQLFMEISGLVSPILEALRSAPAPQPEAEAVPATTSPATVPPQRPARPSVQPDESTPSSAAETPKTPAPSAVPSATPSESYEIRISHQTIKSAEADESIPVQASVSGGLGENRLLLFYRSGENPRFKILTMNAVTGDRYHTNIPPHSKQAVAVEYFMRIVDQKGRSLARYPESADYLRINIKGS